MNEKASHGYDFKMGSGDLPPYDGEVCIAAENIVKKKSEKTSDFGAFLHVLKSSLGSGVLVMPNAFRNGGLIFGIFGSIFVGIVCTHCVHLLVYCAQLLSVKEKKTCLDFPETAEAAFRNGPQNFKRFSKVARNCISGGLVATHYLGTTAYVIFIANTLKQVCDNHIDKNSAYYDLDIRIYTLLVAIPLIPIGSVRSLKYLVPFSFLATILIMGGLITTLYFTLRDLPPVDSRNYVGTPLKIPMFFATVLFAMEGIGTVLPIENSMVNPKHFIGCPGVLNIAMIIVFTLYTIVGFFGYLKFGEETLASITLNLGNTKTAEMVKIAVALSILFSYSLQFTVPTEIIWKWLSTKIKQEWHTISYYIMRVIMICGTIVIAIIIPELGPFISLVGAICFSILGLLVPCIIETATIYDTGYGYLNWRLVKNIAISILSFITLVSGSYSSISEIVLSYKKKNS